MRLALKIVVAMLVIAAAVIAGMIAFGVSEPPPPLASIGTPFKSVDFSDLPAVETAPARNASPIAYRHWPPAPASSAPERVIIAIHGSSATSSSMHPLAKALSVQGLDVYAPDIRGHGGTGQRGDIDYAGQLDRDMEDFVAAIKQRHPQTPIVLLGMSSGGGFALRSAAQPVGKAFERTVLLSPMLGIDAPTVKPNAGGWAAPYVPRIIGLLLINRIGIHAFDYLPVLSFAILPEQAKILTRDYSFRLLRGFGTQNYAEDFSNAPGPLAIVVGQEDELFNAGKFAPTIAAVRKDVPVTVIPGLNHIGLITDGRAVPAIAAAIRGGG
jgi:alpha-beta hydrolase superfamily lysophospholipase